MEAAIVQLSILKMEAVCACHAVASAAPAASFLSLAFIGNPRRAMYRSGRHLYSRGFSITRLEGSRWCLLRMQQVYGESTKESLNPPLISSLKPCGKL